MVSDGRESKQQSPELTARLGLRSVELGCARARARVCVCVKGVPYGFSKPVLPRAYVAFQSAEMRPKICAFCFEAAMQACAESTC